MQMSPTKAQSRFGLYNDTTAAESCDSLDLRFQAANVNSIQMSRARLLLVLLAVCLILGPAGCLANCREEPARDCEAICDASGRNCTIRALVLLPDDNMYQASLPRVLPILKVAEQQIRAKALIPPHIDFEWLAHDTKCDASLGVIKAMDGIIKQCAQVIFGPVCDYSLGE